MTDREKEIIRHMLTGSKNAGAIAPVVGLALSKD